MKIYTRTGDNGTTDLLRGGRVSKDEKRINAYGTVDELNAVIGITKTVIKNDEILSTLTEIQNQLFFLGSDLATPIVFNNKTGNLKRLSSKQVERLESFIDHYQKDLPELKNFILPGGSPGAAYLHFARTVCRRAERDAVSLSRAENIGGFIVKYLNRLSDLLFVLSRFENKSCNTADLNWSKD